MHALGFSKIFLTWTVSYLSNRRQFIQIDDKKSNLERVEFGVPQGFILLRSYYILKLYVSDLQDKLVQCNCFQYADDTTFYNHTKPRDFQDCH